MRILKHIETFFRLAEIFLINIWLKVFKQLTNIFSFSKKTQIESNKIFRDTLSINLTFFTVIVAFYIAITAYFIPQIHQTKLDRDLEFNHMLSEMDNVIPGKTSYKDTVIRKFSKKQFLKTY